MVNVRRESVGPPGSSAEVSVDLRCRSCGKVAAYTLSNVTIVDPRRRCPPGMVVPSDWDGLFTTSVVRCGCGAVDDYEGTAETHLRLAVLALAGTVDRTASGVRAGFPALWDGTIPRRPSEAVRHLRTVAEARPSGEGWRRLGNFQEQMGDLEGAVQSWLRAAEDPSEVEALVSLAIAAYEDGEDPVSLAMAERSLERACRGGPPTLPEPLLRSAVDVLLCVSEGRSLHAAWRAGAVHGDPVVRLSTLRLDRVRFADRLADFLLDAEPFTVRFGPDDLDPDEPETQLERWVCEDDLQTPVRSTTRVGDARRKKKRKAARKARKANRRG